MEKDPRQEQEEFEEALVETREQLDRLRIAIKRLQLVHEYNISKLEDQRDRLD